MGSLVAIFLALGIGILIGGSLGQKWMFQTEQHTLSILMDKYEVQIEENQKLSKDISSLKLIQETVVPMIEQKRILWVRPHDLQSDLLAQMMVSAGVDWEETEADSWAIDGNEGNDMKSFSHTEGSEKAQEQETESKKTDMIIISDPAEIELIMRLRNQLKEGDKHEYTEQASSTPQGIDHHPGVE